MVRGIGGIEPRLSERRLSCGSCGNSVLLLSRSFIHFAILNLSEENDCGKDEVVDLPMSLCTTFNLVDVVQHTLAIAGTRAIMMSRNTYRSFVRQVRKYSR